MPFDDVNDDRGGGGDERHNGMVEVAETLRDTSVGVMRTLGVCHSCCTQILVQMLLYDILRKFESADKCERWLTQNFVPSVMHIIREDRKNAGTRH